MSFNKPDTDVQYPISDVISDHLHYFDTIAYFLSNTAANCTAQISAQENLNFNSWAKHLPTKE